MMTSHDPDNIHSTLKNFIIDKQIGKGQFSCVFRARNKIDGTIVALKKVQVSERLTITLGLFYSNYTIVETSPPLLF